MEKTEESRDEVREERLEAVRRLNLGEGEREGRRDSLVGGRSSEFEPKEKETRRTSELLESRRWRTKSEGDISSRMATKGDTRSGDLLLTKRSKHSSQPS